MMFGSGFSSVVFAFRMESVSRKRVACLSMNLIMVLFFSD